MGEWKSDQYIINEELLTRFLKWMGFDDEGELSVYSQYSRLCFPGGDYRKVSLSKTVPGFIQSFLASKEYRDGND